MNTYIARQPIFNVNRRLLAYELLYRGTKKDTLTSVTGERATTSLLSSAFITEGVNVISGKKPCFINFTEDLLLKKIPLSFPKAKIVVEVLEDVRPTREVVAACRTLVDNGYKLALDDFIYDESFDPLIEVADIIKIDFRLTPVDAIHKTLYHLRKFKIKLLAEKVETLEEFAKAQKMGFTYFQGYFFSKPETIRIKELAAAKINLIHLLSEVAQKTTTLDKLHKIISKDVAISYKLLRFLNSSYFYLIQKVKTIKHAIAYLGEQELRRFIILVIVSELASNKPDELMRLALVRAKFCELLVNETSSRRDSAELFLMGLFSFIDAMLDTTMDEVMAKLPLSSKIKVALIEETGEYAIFLDIIKAYERRQEKILTKALQDLDIDEDLVPEIYVQAIQYANALL